MRRLLSYRLTLLVLLGLLLSVAAERVPGGQLALAPLLALTVPGWLALVAVLAVGWALRRRRIALVPLAALVLAWPQVQRGLPLHLVGSGPLADARVAAPRPPRSLRLLSANVRIFNVYAHLRKEDPAAPAKAISWLMASPADVLCLQEFYQEPAGIRTRDGDLFRVGDKLGAGSGRHVFISKSLTNPQGAQFGLAIFSRLPIVGRGEIAFGRLSQNHAMWVDVVGPGPDTIRVFNLHLQSMSLAEDDIVAASTTEAGMRRKAPNLLRRFRNGAVARAHQADTLVACLARSPYPVLLAGDLNDLPYSYAYDRLADHLQNAWASTGTGIGATYHGKLPGLRIDQQFAGPQWQVLGCRVHREIPWSDHFPVEGLYRLNPPPETGPEPAP